MSENYEQFAKRMEEKFPLMLGNRYGGFAVGEGWWPMLEKLCSIIQSHIDNTNNRRARLLEKNEFDQEIPEEVPQVVVEQIKEKFGSLRFYYQGGDEFIHGAVWMAESMSGQLCETCGAPGERGGSGWISTLCEKHRQEREERKLLKEGFEQ